MDDFSNYGPSQLARNPDNPNVRSSVIRHNNDLKLAEKSKLKVRSQLRIGGTPMERANNINDRLFSKDSSPTKDRGASAFERSNSNGPMFRTLIGPPSTSAYSNTGLMNSTRNDNISVIHKDQVKAKVGYEWKRIFKGLLKADKNSSGAVSKEQFQTACELAGVNLTNDEIRKVGNLFKHESGDIDFLKMSKEMNLHVSSLDYMAQNKDKFKNLNNLRLYLNKQNKSNLSGLDANSRQSDL